MADSTVNLGTKYRASRVERERQRKRAAESAPKTAPGSTGKRPKPRRKPAVANSKYADVVRKSKPVTPGAGTLSIGPAGRLYRESQE
jgi:hypothetical protein